MRGIRNQRGQAMLETVLFVLLFVLALIVGLDVLVESYRYHMGQLEDYYGMPFP